MTNCGQQARVEPLVVLQTEHAGCMSMQMGMLAPRLPSASSNAVLLTRVFFSMHLSPRLLPCTQLPQTPVPLLAELTQKAAAEYALPLE